MVESMHRMTANMETLIEEVKSLRLDMMEGLKQQGKRIGENESSIIRLDNKAEKIDDMHGRLDSLEKAPGKKWDKAVWIIIAAILGLLVTYFAGRYLQT